MKVENFSDHTHFSKLRLVKCGILVKKEHFQIFETSNICNKKL